MLSRNASLPKWLVHDEVRKRLLNHGITEEQLTVRKFVQCRRGIKELLCEVDLAIMPSKSEGFGLVALEALSAGLPVLVGSNSGFAIAIRDLPLGSQAGVVKTSITPSTSTTNVVCGLSFGRSQPDFEGFLRALRFPPSAKLTPSLFHLAI